MTDFAALFMSQAEASSHVQFVYDVPAGRVVFVNSAYEQVLHGRCAAVNEELPGLLARLHPDDRCYLAHYWRMWVRGQMPDEAEVRLQRPNQPDQWFCLTPYCQATGAGGALVAGTLRDISVAKHHQENTDKFNTRKNSALEILSHDLSGAFVLVGQIAQYLREEMPAPPATRVAEMLRVLEATSRSSVKMIRDLVAIEFLASANTDLKLDRVEVGTVLREPLLQLQLGQELLGHHFTYSLPTEPVYANLDVNKFTQVLTNLVSNALKFTPTAARWRCPSSPAPIACASASGTRASAFPRPCSPTCSSASPWRGGAGCGAKKPRAWAWRSARPLWSGTTAHSRWPVPKERAARSPWKYP